MVNHLPYTYVNIVHQGNKDIAIKATYIANIIRYWRKLLQPRCYLCDMPIVTYDAFLCKLCNAELPYSQNDLCPRCGLPVMARQHMQQALCSQCLREPPLWQHFSVCMDYTLESKFLISQLKFAKQAQLAMLLGRLLSRHLASAIIAGRQRPQAIVAIPLHQRRQRQRGYNQAYLLAMEVAKQLQIPLLPTQLFIRSRHSMPQSQCSSAERQRNIKGVFKVTGRLPVQHIAIIDDVMTTQATVREAALTLQQAGAQHIDIWCLARTLRQ